MAVSIFTKVFGSKHAREIKKILPIVDEINRYYEEFQTLSDDELKEQTPKFRQRVYKNVKSTQDEISDLRNELDTSFSEGKDAEYREELRSQIQELEEQESEKIQEVLDEILPEAFAVVKEVCHRLVGSTWNVVDQPTKWDMIPYDVQLIGAIVLHQGRIAEMATGEGKTLAATMPIYLNALPGKGVHLVTVNDYLARRDAEWMGRIYEFLGLRVAYLLNDMSPEERKVAYNADITYGTNNEYGFDYLRDNMAHSLDNVVQRTHHYAIVDEVDSVLIDEARTPLIISGPVSHSTHKYDELKPLVNQLVKKQTVLVNQLLAEAERLLESDDKEKEYEAGIKLLQSQRGGPKNKRLQKMVQERGIAKLITRVENDFIRDKKLHEVDEELYYAIDEKSNVTDLTDKGRLLLSPHDDGGMFIIPDVDAILSEMEGDESLSESEKQQKRAEVYKEYGEVSERAHNVNQLLKAYSLFEKDVEYVVSENKVMIVDEFTGRLMPGRRFSDGLHQALEAKENVKIERETQTLATITLQNYFRMYEKLAGMTGTAETEASEFWEIYKLDVTVIPTNEKNIRIDYEDHIFRTKREKYNAIIDELEKMSKIRRPVLVGTVSVDVSELLSRMLKRRGIRHNVLNAKYHQKEAEIVAKAGEPGMITIATNMAGRGTDIKLGAGVAKNLDGLHIVATERHEARRIDLQLRGRAARQGDPGSSLFYISLEDDLMRLFRSDRIAGVMDRMGLEDGEVIQHSMVTKSIQRAQKKVEAQNFGIRKHLLEYDDVMNKQRENIYRQRNHALREPNLKDDIMEMLATFVEKSVEQYTNKEYQEDWDWDGLRSELMRVLLLNMKIDSEQTTTITQNELFDTILEQAKKLYQRKEESFGSEIQRHLEKIAVLSVIDERWKEHLYEMDMLKEGMGLRAYGQKNPLLEYKQEGFRAFTEMLANKNELVLELVFKAQPTNVVESRRSSIPQEMETSHAASTGMGYQYAGVEEGSGSPVQAASRGKLKPIKVEQKVGRNNPCPCGSGKKYKHCHGR